MVDSSKIIGACTIIAATLLVYVIWKHTHKEQFMVYDDVRYLDGTPISEAILYQTDANNLSKYKRFFDMNAKQRFDIYTQNIAKNAIKTPKTIDYNNLHARHNISQGLINDFYLAARFSLIAYQTDPVRITYDCGTLGATVTDTINDGNMYVYGATLNDAKKTRILCIQGTEFIPGDHNIYQVWSDLSIFPRFVGPYADMYAHSGFFDSVVNLWPQIQNLIDFDEELWIMGHSLGAVRSILIRSLIPVTTKVRITVFGCPRGASAQFYNQLIIPNTTIEYIVAERDFAFDFQPLLPYYHAKPNFYWLTNDSIYYTKERDWLNFSFDDHSIVNSYLPKLAKLAT